MAVCTHVKLIFRISTFRDRHIFTALSNLKSIVWSETFKLFHLLLLKFLPVHELEGTFGEMKWALWRKSFGSQNSKVSLGEGRGCIDEVVLVKTLKASADSRQLNNFLEQILRFHHLPRFDHLAQVLSYAILVVLLNYCSTSSSHIFLF